MKLKTEWEKQQQQQQQQQKKRNVFKVNFKHHERPKLNLSGKKYLSRADRKQVWKSRTLQRLGENRKGQENSKQVKSYFGDGKCGRGEWQEKNCYEESNHNAEQLCAAPCRTVLVVHVAAAGPTELTASDAGVAMPALAIQCDEAFPCLTRHVNSVNCSCDCQLNTLEGNTIAFWAAIPYRAGVLHRQQLLNRIASRNSEDSRSNLYAKAHNNP